MTEDSSNDDTLWGCVGGYVGGFIIIGIIYSIASAIVSWILGWPYFLGHILIGCLSIILLFIIIGYLADASLKYIWPGQILGASDRASQALCRSLFRHEGKLLLFINIKEVDTEERKATVDFAEVSPGLEFKDVQINNIYIAPKSSKVSNRLYSLMNPMQVYLDSFEKAGLQYIPQDSPDGKAWSAFWEIADEDERVKETRERAFSLLNDIIRVAEMDPTNELISGIRKRAAAAKPRIELLIEKIDLRREFLVSSAGKLIELISVPPSLRALGAGDELEINVVDCKGAADDLFEEVRLFEESYATLLEP